MKIFLNNKVYVSKHDIAFLLREQLDIPMPVIYEIDNDILEQCDEYNLYLKHEFAEFTSKEAKEYFKALPFIINYDEYKDTSVDELMRKKCFYYTMKKMFEGTFPTLSYGDVNGIRNCELAIDTYSHLIMSYDELIKYKNGAINIKLPKKDTARDIKHKKFLYTMFASGRSGMNNEKISRR